MLLRMHITACRYLRTPSEFQVVLITHVFPVTRACQIFLQLHRARKNASTLDPSDVLLFVTSGNDNVNDTEQASFVLRDIADLRHWSQGLVDHSPQTTRASSSQLSAAGVTA